MGLTLPSHDTVGFAFRFEDLPTGTVAGTIIMDNAPLFSLDSKSHFRVRKSR